MPTIKATGKEERETRFYISSLDPKAKAIADGAWNHWGIENSLLWVHDVSYGEDKSMKHNQNAIENFSIKNRIAITLVKNEKSKKRNVKGKRLDAGWNNDYLLKILIN